jgi:hypothetical protein
MNSSYISFVIAPSNVEAPLGAEVWLDQQLIFNTESLTAAESIRCDINDEVEADHVLKIVLKNKREEHTVIDADQNIVSDSLLLLSNFELESIAVDQLVLEHAEYCHDFNGNGPAITEKSYGSMGCNGSLSLKFSTPLYIWLLDKM